MILSILKIIGIIFLVILALLIFILGMILFVPIRYQFAGEYKDSLEADVLVRWSPILLNATLNYRDNRLEYVVRMLGGVVLTNLDIPLSWIGRKFFASGEEEDFAAPNDTMEFEQSKQGVNRRIREQKRTSVTKAVKSKPPKKKKLSIVGRIRQKIQSMKQKIKQFVEKLKKLNEKREALLKVYHHKRFEIAKKDVIAYIKALWNSIKPKHLEGKIHFGLNDPAATGQVLGVMAVFLMWYHAFLQIEPDFEKSCLDGYLKGDGRIRIFPVVKLIIRVAHNKNLIKVIKKVQTIIEA